MFEQFPKVRPDLPESFQRIYASHYKENRTRGTAVTSLTGRVEAWLHRQVAADVLKSGRPAKTLEIGAGTLNQHQYEPEVGPYDIVEPAQGFYENAPSLPRCRRIYTDIGEIPLNERYDRITSIATFEHICNLPEVVARCGVLLGQQGILRVGIPSEGTWLWWLGWRLTTGVEFRFRYGLDYGLLMKYEHVNDATEIEEVLRYFFSRVDLRVLGLCRGVSLLQFFSCGTPYAAACHSYLADDC